MLDDAFERKKIKIAGGYIVAVLCGITFSLEIPQAQTSLSVQMADPTQSKQGTSKKTSSY